MTGQVLTVVSGALTVLLGGGLIKGILDYLADRRRTSNDFSIATFTTLKEMNDRLKAEVNDLHARLDDERHKRYALEDRVAGLERELAARQQEGGGRVG